MPTYKFEAMDTAGGEVKDAVDAPSEEEAQQKIKQMGYFVTKITEVSTGKKGTQGPTSWRYCFAMTRATCATCPKSCTTQAASSWRSVTGPSLG